MSGIVESGRENGHGDIDANDPIADNLEPCAEYRLFSHMLLSVR